MADGFSCKTRIEHAGTGRHALHIAEVMKPAREQGKHAPTRLPERSAASLPRPPMGTRALRVSATTAPGAALITAVLWPTPA
jgi:hypothetical protein